MSARQRPRRRHLRTAGAAVLLVGGLCFLAIPSSDDAALAQTVGPCNTTQNPPQIIKASYVLVEADPVMIVTGTCFGASPATVTVQDVSEGWTAKTGNVLCNIGILNWSDTQIEARLYVNENWVVPDYLGFGKCPLSSGDTLLVTVGQSNSAGSIHPTKALEGYSFQITSPSGTSMVTASQLKDFITSYSDELPQGATVNVSWIAPLSSVDAGGVGGILDAMGTAVSTIEAVPDGIEWAATVGEQSGGATGAVAGASVFTLKEAAGTTLPSSPAPMFANEWNVVSSSVNTAVTIEQNAPTAGCVLPQGMDDPAYYIGSHLLTNFGSLLVTVTGVSQPPTSLSIPMLQYWSFTSTLCQDASLHDVSSSGLQIVPLPAGTFTATWTVQKSLPVNGPPNQSTMPTSTFTTAENQGSAAILGTWAIAPMTDLVPLPNGSGDSAPYQGLELDIAYVSPGGVVEGRFSFFGDGLLAPTAKGVLAGKLNGSSIDLHGSASGISFTFSGSVSMQGGLTINGNATPVTFLATSGQPQPDESCCGINKGPPATS